MKDIQDVFHGTWEDRALLSTQTARDKPLTGPHKKVGDFLCHQRILRAETFVTEIERENFLCKARYLYVVRKVAGKDLHVHQINCPVIET